LLQKAHSKELKKIKQEERIKRALDEKFPSARDAPTEVRIMNISSLLSLYLSIVTVLISKLCLSIK
jgi:hypothetical protein